ncbi:MAG: hypothetical protein V7746_23005, partial [Halioglobus sp.]
MLPVLALAQPVEEDAEVESDESQRLFVVDTEPPLTTEIIEESLGREKNADGTWVDSSHEYIGTKADD